MRERKRPEVYAIAAHYSVPRGIAAIILMECRGDWSLMRSAATAYLIAGWTEKQLKTYIREAR